LRSRADRITDQFKTPPEVDRIENDAIEARERAAWKRAEFWMVDDRDGTARGGFRIPIGAADQLKAAIETIAAPKRDHLRDHPAAEESYYDRDLDHRTRLGMGFAELAGHLPGNCLPSKGGLGATLIVRLDHGTLVDGVKAATLSTGTRISASEARLMACNAGIIPQIFGGKSLPLDHGHEQRLFTPKPRNKVKKPATADAHSPPATNHPNNANPITGG